MNLTLREEIVNALCEGFGYDAIVDVEVAEECTCVVVKDFDEPITVFPEAIEVPDCFPDEIKAGIRLDIMAILSEVLN